jgi:hypothetical protein
MKLANTYRGMLEELGRAFETRYRRKDVNLTGILFARPASKFAKEEILPHINFWHHRSDDYTDFFCPGYFSRDVYSDTEVVTTVDGTPWYFSDHALTQFLKEFEKGTTWRYNGGCELVVTNVRYREEPINQLETRKKASLDLTSAIAIDLERAHEDKVFLSATNLASVIFDFAKGLNADVSDPCWTFSDKQGMRIIKGSLKEFLIAYLPSWVKPEARKAFHLVASDLSHRAT